MRLFSKAFLLAALSGAGLALFAPSSIAQSVVAPVEAAKPVAPVTSETTNQTTDTGTVDPNDISDAALFPGQTPEDLANQRAYWEQMEAQNPNLKEMSPYDMYDVQKAAITVQDNVENVIHKNCQSENFVTMVSTTTFLRNEKVSTNLAGPASEKIIKVFSSYCRSSMGRSKIEDFMPLLTIVHKAGEKAAFSYYGSTMTLTADFSNMDNFNAGSMRASLIAALLESQAERLGIVDPYLSLGGIPGGHPEPPYANMDELLAAAYNADYFEVVSDLIGGYCRTVTQRLISDWDAQYQVVRATVMEETGGDSGSVVYNWTQYDAFMQTINKTMLGIIPLDSTRYPALESDCVTPVE